MTQQDKTGRRYDLFFRNPKNYHIQLCSMGEFNVAWDRGQLIKYKLDPVQWARAVFGNQKWRTYCVGDYFTQEYDSECKPNRPKAVYPSWSYKKDKWEDLLNYIEEPWGSNAEYCTDKTLPLVERPVFGQPHRIIINEMPPSGTAAGDLWWSRLSDLQEAHPDVELFIHRAYSYQIIFGMAFTAGSVDARTDAAKKTVRLPNGVYLSNYSKKLDFKADIEALGYSPEELELDARSCCEFNILTARLAAHNWHSYRRPPRRRPVDFEPDVNSPKMTAMQPQVNESRWSKGELRDIDLLLCNNCSVWRKCSNFKEGSVCTLTNSPGKGLADHFKSTDPKKILEGLRSVVAKQAERVDDALRNESVNEPDKEIDKQLNNVFRNATTLAKLVDPSLRGGGVNVAVVNGVPQGGFSAAAAITQGNTKALAGGLMKEIEQATGLPREQITDDVIEAYLEENAPQDAEVVEE